MKLIQSLDAPIPKGHYSQAVIANGFIFLSGLLPIIAGSNCVMPTGISEQTKQVFKNMKVILEAANSDISKLVSVQLFIPDIEFWGLVNEVYAEMLQAHKPARTIIPCGPLHYGALIEVSAIAIT